MIGQSRISPQHFFVSHGPTDVSALPDDSEAANSDADRIVSDFVTRTRTSDRVASTVTSQIGLRYSAVQVIRDIYAAVMRRAASSDLMTPTGSDHARLALLACLNRFRLRTCMRWDSIRHGEKYVLFPLQFYPETSSTFWANDQHDQAAVVGRVASALPFGWNLAVKEHVVFSGYRTFADYRRIQSLPNVRLVNPMTSTRRLIEQSSGVVTLSSTAGLEALILGKPVLMLGEGMYRGFDGVITLPTADADSITNLRRAISTLVSSPGPSFDIVSRQLTREARKIFRGSVMWPSKEAASPDNIARISEALWKCAGCGNRVS